MLYYGDKKPTKERIIDAAFSLFNDFRFKDISLNEVAVAAGISKTAIFRHFENKDSLVNTMSAYLFDTIADIINGIYNTIQFSTDKTDCEEKLWKQAITQCIKHISLNKTYLFYLVYLFSNTKDPNLLLYKELKARNIDLYDKGTVSIEDDHLIIKQLKPFLRIVYITNSILFFTLHAYKHNSQALDQEHIDDFCNNLCDYLYYGTAYPQHYLTIENMQHLDTLVDLTTEKLPPEDPLLIAISTVMREHGANGTTLELIAQQIGLAKSSLYTYFNNKTEMFTKLIQRELVLLSQLLTNITQKVQDNAQRNYLLIKTQISFYLLRPSLIPALTWMTINETILPPEVVCQSFDIDISVFNKAIPDFRGAPMKIATYYNWMGMLTSSFFMHSLRDTYIINHIDMIEKLLFIYIQRGVKQDDNQSSYDAGGNRV